MIKALKSAAIVFLAIVAVLVTILLIKGFGVLVAILFGSANWEINYFLGFVFTALAYFAAWLMMYDMN